MTLRLIKTDTASNLMRMIFMEKLSVFCILNASFFDTLHKIMIT